MAKDLRFNKVNKIQYKFRITLIRFIKIISQDMYVKKYRKLLADYGMNVDLNNWGYIDPTAFFDNYDYTKITIGQDVTISRDVLILNHDFSVMQGLRAIGKNQKGYFLKEVKIGDNCFIGAKATLLPGTIIGKNSIIGAGSVVKGVVPENSVVVGNPARVIMKTSEFGNKHYVLHDYIEVE